MADTLLQDLTELSSPALTDLLYMVADPAGTPADHKVQFSTVLDRAKGYSIILDASGKGDYTDLATALAALSAGDVLFIRNGTYTGGVTIATDEITVIGETRNGVIIQSIANNSAPAIAVAAANVTLQNFKIDGLRDTQGTANQDTGTWSGIRITHDGCIVENVWVFEPYGHGISAAADDGRITNCLVQNRATDGVTLTEGKYAYGIVVYGGSRWTIAYNRVTGFSQACGLWWGCDDNVVAFNKFVSNYGASTGAMPGGGRSAVEDYGAEAINHRNLWFGNLMDGTIGYGIECAQGVIGSQFISNVCKNTGVFNTGGGMIIASGSATEPTYDILFANNSLFGTSTAVKTEFVILTRGTVKITGNTFVDCAVSGSQPMNVYGADTQAIIRENVFRNCAGAMRITNGQPSVIDGNSITLPASTGTMIFVGSAASTSHSITNNVFDANGVGCKGIDIDAGGGDYHRITNNTFRRFISWGIDMRRGFCIVTHNFISTTYVDGGILLYGSSALQNTVKYNIIDCNQAHALVVGLNAAYNVVQENTLIGASAALYNSSAVLTNQTTPNHAGTFTRIVGVLKSLGAQTVGASQATIAHGLAYTPTEVQVTMTSAGTIWKSAASDGTNIYLTADDADRTAEIFVR